MRVFQLCAGAAEGGAETAFVDFCIALHERGHEVTAITRPHPVPMNRLRDAGLEPVALPFGGAFDFKTAAAIKKLVREKKPQIVQSWMSRAAKFSPKSGTPDMPDFKVVSRLGNCYAIKYFKNTDHFVTITPEIKTYLEKNGIAPERVTHINNFADVEAPSADPIKRADLATPDNAFLCLTLSRLHDAKGIDTFLDALAQLPDNVHAWLAGDGPDRAKLEKQAAMLGLNDRVRFLGWRTDRADLLAACDALVFPSRYEPFGSTFIQAWAADRPLVTTDADGPRQYVRDGQDGLVVPINEAAALAKAIARLQADPALRQTLVKQGKKRFEAEFTRDACMDAYLKLYAALTEA